MKRIKWKNVIKLTILIISTLYILHDVYMLTINNWFKSNNYVTWTWLGFITFILFITISTIIYEDFVEQIKSIQSYRPKHAKDTSK